MTIIIITLFIALFVLCIFVIYQDFKQKKEIEDTIFNFSQGHIVLTPSEFLEIRNKSFGGQGRPKYANYFDFIGIYIILNNSKKNYYIGQSQKVIDGINKQFTGKGNQYLYNDYITGDTFLSKAIRLDTSGFDTIEELKKSNVNYYHQEYQSYSSSMRNNKIQPSKSPKDRTANTLSNSPVAKKHTVTQRINDIKQPYGGYLPVKEFEVVSFEDKKSLGEENIHGSLIGITVDYITRFVNGASASKAFSVSLQGARLVKKEEEAKKLLYNIDSLSDISIISACKLSGFDVAFRAGPASYTKSIEDINPDDSTIKNIRIMVERSTSFFKKYGPVIKDGFTFEGGYSDIIVAGDGDFLTKDTLWDVKVIKSKPTSKHTLQLLIYFIMGLNSIHAEFDQIKYLGIFNPRWNKVYLYDTNNLDRITIDQVRKDVIGYN